MVLSLFLTLPSPFSKMNMFLGEDKNLKKIKKPTALFPLLVLAVLANDSPQWSILASINWPKILPSQHSLVPKLTPAFQQASLLLIVYLFIYLEVGTRLSFIYLFIEV